MLSLSPAKSGHPGGRPDRPRTRQAAPGGPPARRGLGRTSAGGEPGSRATSAGAFPDLPPTHESPRPSAPPGLPRPSGRRARAGPGANRSDSARRRDGRGSRWRTGTAPRRSAATATAPSTAPERRATATANGSRRARRCAPAPAQGARAPAARRPEHELTAGAGRLHGPPTPSPDTGRRARRPDAMTLVEHIGRAPAPPDRRPCTFAWPSRPPWPSSSIRTSCNFLKEPYCHVAGPSALPALRDRARSTGCRCASRSPPTAGCSWRRRCILWELWRFITPG